jgi:pimeloyl-ACP methyl ester carboxylesterase
MSTSNAQTVETIAVNGTQITYTDQGTEREEAIVMIHAGICDQRMWKPQVAHFVQRYRVVTLDMRGFGQSKMGSTPFTFHDDVLAVMDHLGIQQAWLLACSMGGAVALDLTLTNPERVRGLLLSGPALGGYRYTGTPHSLKEAIQEAEERGDLEAVSELEVQMWVDGIGRISQEVDPSLRKAVWHMNLIPLRVDDAAWDLEQEIDPPAIERLGKIAVPTLIIIGSLDLAQSQERANILFAQIPHSEKVTISGTAHLPSMERPVEFNQHIDEFLAKHTS